MIALFTSLDASVEGMLIPRRPALVRFFYRVTQLGGVILIPLLALSSLIFFMYGGYTSYALGLAVGLGGALIFGTIVQHIFERERPVGSLIEEFGHSFPSRHAVAATVLYGFIGYTLIQMLGFTVSTLISSILLALLVVLIALSRVYLRVHHASDVIVGVCIGLVFLVLGIALV